MSGRGGPWPSKRSLTPDVPLGVESRKRQLDAFFARALALSSRDEELRSDMARHGVVLICGFIERCVEEIILVRVKQLANVRVQSFVKSHFRRGTNYNCVAITSLLERFDLNWAFKFRSFLNGRDDLVEAIRSAYEVRNSIAHGGEASKGLTDVIRWFNAAQEVVNAMILATS